MLGVDGRGLNQGDAGPKWFGSSDAIGLGLAILAALISLTAVFNRPHRLPPLGWMAQSGQHISDDRYESLHIAEKIILHLVGVPVTRYRRCRVERHIKHVVDGIEVAPVRLAPFLLISALPCRETLRSLQAHHLKLLAAFSHTTFAQWNHGSQLF